MSANSYIYHITTQEDWNAAQTADAYTTESLAREGFIHCSRRDQILATAVRFYSKRTGLMLLCIDPRAVIAPIRNENLEGGETLFPHIYGPLNLSAVLMAVPFPAQADGSFQFPKDLVETP
jgi:uncharacterized protein (DUF952 family)